MIEAVGVELTDEGKAAKLTRPARISGSYRLVLEAEHGIRTETEPRAVTVRPDQPPAFVQVKASEALKAVLPYDKLPIEFTIDDDVAVAVAEIEYRVNVARSCGADQAGRPGYAERLGPVCVRAGRQGDGRRRGRVPHPLPTTVACRS
jgi:hypothetical protein